MSVIYGADYSATELSPSELDSFRGYDIRFLMRYIGYPDNPKCISHYPGAYRAHVKAGRTVLLVAEYGTNDPAGGYAGGVAMARRALQDADSIGYPASLPIFFCADGWLASSNISVATAMSYLDGAASIMGRQRTGAYGFRDFIEPAKQGGHARWLWLAGQAPSDSELAAGWPHFYQWNNGVIHPGGVDADLDWAYPGVLEALHTVTPAPGPTPSPAPAPGPARGPAPTPGPAPAWPLPPDQYFGLIGGPAAAHGGINATERGWVRLIQQALIRKGFVPGISDPGSSWADGVYQEPTREAVLTFQRSVGYVQTGNIWPDDWARLLS